MLEATQPGGLGLSFDAFEHIVKRAGLLDLCLSFCVALLGALRSSWDSLLNRLNLQFYATADQ